MPITYRGDETTGFQSPAQDYVEEAVDLADLLDLRRPNRFPVRVIGQALRVRGIEHGDVLVVDTAAEPVSGRVCIAMVGGDVILAVLGRDGEGWALRPSSGPPVAVQGDDVEVWGIVYSLVRREV
jgi:DNA polymerase V